MTRNELVIQGLKREGYFGGSKADAINDRLFGAQEARRKIAADEQLELFRRTAADMLDAIAEIKNGS